MTAQRSIVLDLDPGIDDAIAILYLAARPDVEIVALGSVHGNCNSVAAAENAIRLFDLCGLDDVPVAIGADHSISGGQCLAPAVHGQDGLGDVGFPPPSREASGEHAADQLVRLGFEHPGELDLLAAGPLTNLGLAIQRDPELLTRYRSVVVMGGSGPFPPPGILRESDSNTDNDVDAAMLVYGSPRRELVMVGTNVCTPTLFDEAAFERVCAADTPQAKFVAQTLPWYLDFYQHHYGRKICPLYDPLAAAVLVDRSYATESVDGPVNILDNGYGGRAWLMRLEDGSLPVQPILPVPDTRVVTAVDGDRFTEELVERLVTPLPVPGAVAER